MHPASDFRIRTGMIQALVLATLATAHADMILWNGSNDPFWGKGNNWTGGPGADRSR